MDSSAKEPQAPQQGSETARDAPRNDAVPAVRFSSAVEEISPSANANRVGESEAENDSNVFNDVAEDQMKAFSKPVRGQDLQERRLSTFNFEAFSLPPSRVPSRDEDSPGSSRLHTPTSSAFQSPHGSPRLSALASPPLTPSGSGGADKSLSASRERKTSGAHDPAAITPQPSSSNEKTTQAAQERRPLAHRPASDHALRRASSVEERLGAHQSHRRGMLSSGAGSVPVSRESSPSRSSASHYYSKPINPVGDLNDPYAKGRRPAPQAHTNRHSIDPRFVFSRKKHHHSPSASKTSLTGSGAFAKNGDDSDHSSTGHGHGHHAHGSMADLKRFFRKNGHHNKKREASPARSVKANTPPPSRSSHQVPFADDHGLTSKYGKLGKVLGSGAGGSVRLMRRREDGTVFAVKEFRARHTYETEKEYNKKVTAEFCVGSTLHHGNIIETLDILQEKGRWFEVMEYAPYDLFAIVMTGRMTRDEVSCCFLQILSGVTYLHSLGLAHRDLKLDNVVVSDKGIMKIIDFGSAHVFKYPFETAAVPAKGIVGSDPYLAPEVYDSREYDAAAVDVWSLAIIYCCMSLRRFPWKIPRMTDNSFKLFAAEPTPGHDPKKLLVSSRSTGDLGSMVPRDFLTGDEGREKKKEEQSHNAEKKTESSAVSPPATSAGAHNGEKKEEKKEVIRGPWRILRLLPRESRNIIHRMLDMNPKTRAKMDEILEEPWVADTVICQQLEDGGVLSAESHTHVLEPPNNPDK